MLPDLEKKYRSLSVVELLKIIQQPEKYRAEAIDTARNILKEKTVTEADENAVYEYFLDQKKNIEEIQARQHRYAKKATDLLDPVLNPTEDSRPVYWLNILLLYITIFDGWLFITRSFNYSQQYNSNGLNFVNSSQYFSILQFLLIPVYILLLWKNARWGWILLVAVKTTIVVSFVLNSPLYLAMYETAPQLNLLPFIFSFESSLAVLLFMFNNKVAENFNITPKIKLNTIAISLLSYFLLSIIFSIA